MTFGCGMSATIVAAVCAMFAAIAFPAAQAFTPAVIPKPTPDQLRYHSWEITAMLGYNMGTYCGGGQCDPGSSQAPPPSTFWPTSNATADEMTTQWVETSQKFKAKMVVLVSDHFSGFSLWPTKFNNYSVAYSGWHNGTQDIVASFLKSCKDHDVAPGTFYSIHVDCNNKVDVFKVINGTAKEQAAFTEQTNKRLKELLDYGDWQEVWFDGGINESTVPGIANTTSSVPHGVTHSAISDEMPSLITWVGTGEEAVAPLTNWNARTPDGPVYCPNDCDTVLHEHFWFWDKDVTTKNLKSVPTLLQNYLTSVGRGCNIILNIAPDLSGFIPEQDVKRYEEFGEAIDKLYAKQWAAPTSLVPKKTTNSSSGAYEYTWTLKCNSTAEPMRNGSIIIQEDLTEGQHIGSFRAYLDVKQTTTLLYNGTTVGSKRIGMFALPAHISPKDEPVVRLVVDLSYGAAPSLHSAGVYNWDGLDVPLVP